MQNFTVSQPGPLEDVAVMPSNHDDQRLGTKAAVVYPKSKSMKLSWQHDLQMLVHFAFSMNAEYARPGVGCCHLVIASNGAQALAFSS